MTVLLPLKKSRHFVIHNNLGLYSISKDSQNANDLIFPNNIDLLSFMSMSLPVPITCLLVACFFSLELSLIPGNTIFNAAG